MADKDKEKIENELTKQKNINDEYSVFMEAMAEGGVDDTQSGIGSKAAKQYATRLKQQAEEIADSQRKIEEMENTSRSSNEGNRNPHDSSKKERTSSKR